MLPMVFGYPMPETFEAAERGEIALGGCVVTGEDPTHQCSACGEEVIVDALTQIALESCATCSLPLDGDPDDALDGDAGMPICGDSSSSPVNTAVVRRMASEGSSRRPGYRLSCFTWSG